MDNRWLGFWGRAVTNGLQWGKAVVEHVLFVVALLFLVFGVAVVVWPLREKAQHHHTHHFPVLWAVALLGIALLITLCHGAYVTWRDDQEKAEGTKAELDALVAERTAPKPIPEAHVTELKAMLQRIQKAVQHSGPIAYGDGPYEREAIFQEAFNTHFPDLVPVVTAWDFARFRCQTLDASVKALAVERTNDLVGLGILGQAASYVINTIQRVASGQEPFPNVWTGYEMQGPGTTTLFWNRQEVAVVIGDREAQDAAVTAYEKLLTEAPTWAQVADLVKVTYEFDSITQNLVAELAKAHARHMTQTVNRCAMCPEYG